MAHCNAQITLLSFNIITLYSIPAIRTVHVRIILMFVYYYYFIELGGVVVPMDGMP